MASTMPNFDGQTVRLGTRKSQLALWQTYSVRDQLQKLYPKTTFDIVEMSTKGDEVLDRALFKIGDKSLFTKELENALIEGKVDMVVHSLKDLPSTLPDGLIIGAVLERETPNDVVVIAENSSKTWEDVVATEGAMIGTSSVRRSAQLKSHYPNLKFQDIRGNLNTRLAKLDCPNSPYNAIVLAAAGLIRLDMAHRIHKVLDNAESLHAVGQGALAVESRKEDENILAMLRTLNHKPTVQAVMAERAFMRVMDGGCSAPLAAHAYLPNEFELRITGGVWSLDGKVCVKSEISVHLDGSRQIEDVNELAAITIPLNEHKSQYAIAHEAGIALAKDLSKKGGLAILKGAKAETQQIRDQDDAK